ncbi:MAG: phosphatase PAP2 family protein [Actinomycetota bacterium]
MAEAVEAAGGRTSTRLLLADMGEYERRPRHGIYALCAVAVLVLCSIAADGGSVSGPEEDVFRAIQDLPDFLKPLFWPVMQFGNLVMAFVATAIALVTRRWRLGSAFLLLAAGKLYFGRLVKEHVTRHRPDEILENVVLRDSFGGGLAFVSGHAVIAFGIATLAHPYLGRVGRIIVWSLAAGAGLGRIYVGAHLPLDVVGGAALGVALGLLFGLITGVPPSEETVVAT